MLKYTLHFGGDFIKLYFQNSQGEERLIAEVKSEQEAFKEIEGFCEQRNWKIPYYNVHDSDDIRIYDVGSYTEFFRLKYVSELQEDNKETTPDTVKKIGNITFEAFDDALRVLRNMINKENILEEQGVSVGQLHEINQLEDKIIFIVCLCMGLDENKFDEVHKLVEEYCYSYEWRVERNLNAYPMVSSMGLWENIIQVLKKDEKMTIFLG